MKTYTKNFNMKRTPQNQWSPGTVENNAGGYVFQIDKWSQLDRFLILGSEGGTYYVNDKTLTIENAKNVLACIKADGIRVVNKIIEVSVEGRAPSNDPALFALALVTAYGDGPAKTYAFQSLSKIARIGTHLFHFAQFRKLVAGWGSGMKRAVGRWYQEKDIDDLGYQLIKYRQRDGWTHKDLIRLAHPQPLDEKQNALFAWIAKDIESPALPRIVDGFLHAQAANDIKTVVKLINEYGLPREAIPTQYLNSSEVWEALLYSGKYGMPIGALVRNLNKMTAVGLLQPIGEATNYVTEKLLNDTAVLHSKIHPLQVITALYAYQTGGQQRKATWGPRGGIKSKFTWKPVQHIVDALEDTFNISFGSVEPTGKRTLLALDISASMDWSFINNTCITACEASAAMAMVTARVEAPGSYMFGGFSRNFLPLNISPKQSMGEVLKTIKNLPHGGTDCALPMIKALKNKWEVDTFVVFTDSETWAGTVKPHQALKEYRNKMGTPAKLIVVGMTASKFSIADPNDKGMLDVVGFSTATPNVISDFSKN